MPSDVGFRNGRDSSLPLVFREARLRAAEGEPVGAVPGKPHNIVFAAFEGMRVLDLVGPLDAFSFANDLRAAAGETPYRLIVVSEHGGPLRTSCGLAIATEPLSALDGIEIDTLIVAGGAAALRRESNPAAVNAWLTVHAGLVAWLGRRGAQARRICSVCTGSFLLAASGQLAGRTVATHWAAAKLLADCFPALRVEADCIFVRDGRVWTSGGVTSGIDLALALIEEDLGSEVALKTARVMVVFVKRPGGQSQFSTPLAAQVSDPGGFADLHGWIAEHLADELRIEELSARVGMSRRTFMRTYTAAVGRTPARTIEAMRLDAARLALEETDKSFKVIARQSGFGTVLRMRRVFQRQLGVSPADYRARFSSRAFAAPPEAEREPRPRAN